MKSNRGALWARELSRPQIQPHTRRTRLRGRTTMTARCSTAGEGAQVRILALVGPSALVCQRTVTWYFIFSGKAADAHLHEKHWTFPVAPSCPGRGFLRPGEGGVPRTLPTPIPRSHMSPNPPGGRCQSGRQQAIWKNQVLNGEPGVCRAHRIQPRSELPDFPNNKGMSLRH